MTKHDVKLTLTRDQRRSLDRAAKASGLKTGPWVRQVALVSASQGSDWAKLAQGRPFESPDTAAQRPPPSSVAVAPQKPPLRPFPAAQVGPCKLCGKDGGHKPACPNAPARDLTYAPDA